MNTSCDFRKVVTNRSMGMEWECFVNEHIPTQQHYSFWYATTDGSIHLPSYDEYGREFVSQPLPYKWLKKEINRLHTKLKEFNPDVRIAWNHTCGIHIHVDRRWATQRKHTAIANFLEKHPECYERWFGRRSNNYCEIPASYNKTSRYRNVNITNISTVEFRMFSSGSAAWAQYCVDCVKYMLDNHMQLNVDAFHAFRDMYNFD